MRLLVTSRQLVAHGIAALAAEGDTVWVADPAAGQITRLGPDGRTSVHTGGTPISLAVGFGRLWVADRDEARVLTLDAGTLAKRTTFGVTVPVAVVTGPLGPWALSLDTGSLYRLDPVSGASTRHPYDSPVASPVDMVVAGGELWVLGAGEGGVGPFSSTLGRIVRSGFTLPGRALSGMSAAGSTIWLAEPHGRSLLRVDTKTASVRQIPAPYGIQPIATAIGSCGVWAGGASGELALVDPRTGAPLGPALRIGAALARMSAAGNGVWITDPLDGTVVHVEAVPAP